MIKRKNKTIIPLSYSYHCKKMLSKYFCSRIFIRAPGVVGIQNGVEILALLGEKKILPQERNHQNGVHQGNNMAKEPNQIIGVRQGNNMATAFHPELTTDPRFHIYFINMVLKEADSD